MCQTWLKNFELSHNFELTVFELTGSDLYMSSLYSTNTHTHKKQKKVETHGYTREYRETETPNSLLYRLQHANPACTCNALARKNAIRIHAPIKQNNGLTVKVH